MTQFYVVGTKDLVEDLGDLRKSGYNKPGNPDLEIISIIQPTDVRWAQILKVSSDSVDVDMENKFCSLYISKKSVNMCPSCGELLYEFSITVEKKPDDENFRKYL